MATITREQYDFLIAPLNSKRVAVLKGQSHLEAWDVRRHLIRFFGFGGWDFKVVTCDLVAEWTHPPKDDSEKPRYSVVYRVIGRLIVRDRDGNLLCTYEDGACGDSMNQPSFGDAHDMALKTALSQALKRCAVNLGDQFGLSLYKDGSTAATVQRSLVAPEVTDDSTGDGDGGGAEPRSTGPGPGSDGAGAGESGPGRDGEAGSVRPGVQPGVSGGGGVDRGAQAHRGDRDAPAAAGQRRG